MRGWRRTVLVVAVLVLVAVAGVWGLGSRDGGPLRPRLDVQAHRGGLGLRPESSAGAFAHALALGVTTLELDVQITADGQPVVTHDRRVNPVVCRDTAPVAVGDRAFPYMGKLVKDLSVAQLKTLDCGSRHPVDPAADPVVDSQLPVPGSRMLTLAEVFDLVRRSGADGPDGVRLTIETKVEAGAPEQTAPREQFVEVTVEAVRRAGLLGNVDVQSFDWGALRRVREIEPRLPIVALDDGRLLQVGRPGASPWLGGIDIDDFAGDPVRAAASFGADALSPVHGDPQGGSVLDPGYRPYTTEQMVDAAHAAGMRVVPWTVDDVATMNRLIDMGVDGIITDYPDRLRDVLDARGYALPPQFDRSG